MFRIEYNGVLWRSNPEMPVPHTPPELADLALRMFEMLGFIPSFVNVDDPRTAKEQIHENYVSGWHDFKGFVMEPNGDLSYPGDPDTKLLWEGRLRQERIRVYESAWVAIVQPDETYEVARLD